MRYRMVVWALPAILVALVTVGSAYSPGSAVAWGWQSEDGSENPAAENVTVVACDRTVQDSPVDGNATCTLARSFSSGENGTRMIVLGNLTELPEGAVSIRSDREIMFVTVRTGESPVVVNMTPFNAEGYVSATVTVTDTAVYPLPVNGKVFFSPEPKVSFFHDTVPENQQHEWIDLDWADPLMDLELMVYTPDATLGPYNDTSDRVEDDRIFLDIGRNGTIAPGNWFFRVRNLGTGSGEFAMNTYSV